MTDVLLFTNNEIVCFLEKENILIRNIDEKIQIRNKEIES